MLSYEEWQAAVPPEIRSDALWRITAYRLALYLSDLAWHDATLLMRDRRTLGLAGQFYDAAGSISANIGEGYSRGTGRDRARFYEYALGSAREARDWYFKGRHVLDSAVVRERLALLREIIQLLLTMVPEQRAHLLKDGPPIHESLDA
jgi:four helix bundle protein